MLNVLNKISKTRNWKPVSAVQLDSFEQIYYLSQVLLKTPLAVVGGFVIAGTSQILPEHKLQCVPCGLTKKLTWEGKRKRAEGRGRGFITCRIAKDIMGFLSKPKQLKAYI